ncbi:MAG: Lrp/AsnC family transcriptional regulator [Candidatus Aminicenantes bacterium]|nr:Lrp/AsnC family transcriptional regulator [Candidatus Aminicenantes bacterium]
MIDDLDRKIIRILNNDARLSYREIARKAGASVTAVSRKVKQMESAGALRGYVPRVDPAAFGLDLTAVIALRISKGRLLETQARIAKDPRVSAVYDITGEWDSLVIGRFRGRDDLNAFIKHLLSQPYVVRSVTHIALNTVKEDPRIPV